MVVSEQQKQTQKFFERFAKQWSRNAKSNYSDFVNIVKIRNEYVTSIAKKYLKRNSKTLDLGCGSGDLVIKLLQNHFEAKGIDFASTMIKKAKQTAKRLNLPEGSFIHKSIFDFQSDEKFDLISANGVIEYVSEGQLNDIIKLSHALLKKNGILILESRNRLFNVVSFNEYTKNEMRVGEVENLLDECLLFNKFNNFNDVKKTKFVPKISKRLKKHQYTESKYAKIVVDTRNQYTPFELIRLLGKMGFSIVDLYPLHIHALTTGAKAKRPEIHTQLAYFLIEQKDILLKLIPYSSSFMITVKKI